MKLIFAAVLLCFIIYQSNAQGLQRNIRFRSFPGDSIVLTLNNEYYLIEDSCAQIIRYGHFNFKQKTFFGKFRDVSKSDTTLVVSEGTYMSDGLKEGEFTSHYLNGKLRAKGSFVNNKYDGKWEIYYDTGKPELTFEVIDGDYRIIDAWNPEGAKIVNNGTGSYLTEVLSLRWKGKLVNGKPDGTWNLYRIGDNSNTSISTEHFKKGEFREGSAATFNYTDKSHIQLVSPFKLPFVNAERLLISAVACDGSRTSHSITGCQYATSGNDFTRIILNNIAPPLQRVDLKGIDNTIIVEGEISENGSVKNLKDVGESPRDDIFRILMRGINTVPVLSPAKIDNKPTIQKFRVTLIVRDGFYQVSSRFFPVTN